MIQLGLLGGWLALNGVALGLAIVGLRRAERRRRAALLPPPDPDLAILAGEHVRLWLKWRGQAVIGLTMGLAALAAVAFVALSTLSGWVVTVGLFAIVGWLVAVEWKTLREQARIEKGEM